MDASGDLDISDAIRLLGYLFTCGNLCPIPCPDAGDADDNGVHEITDPINILGYLFLGRTGPPAPGARLCGADPTADALGGCGSVCR